MTGRIGSGLSEKSGGGLRSRAGHLNPEKLGASADSQVSQQTALLRLARQCELRNQEKPKLSYEGPRRWDVSEPADFRAFSVGVNAAPSFFWQCTSQRGNWKRAAPIFGRWALAGLGRIPAAQLSQTVTLSLFFPIPLLSSLLQISLWVAIAA